jgi:hypothetical protein
MKKKTEKAVVVAAAAVFHPHLFTSIHPVIHHRSISSSAAKGIMQLANLTIFFFVLLHPFPNLP